MPIISVIGRRSLKTRLLIGTIYVLLLVGATSMIYPFCLMIAGTTKSNVDTPEAKVIPDYLKEEEGLYRKYAEAFFIESGSTMREIWRGAPASFRNLELPYSLIKVGDIAQVKVHHDPTSGEIKLSFYDSYLKAPLSYTKKNSNKAMPPLAIERVQLLVGNHAEKVELKRVRGPKAIYRGSSSALKNRLAGQIEVAIRETKTVDGKEASASQTFKVALTDNHNSPLADEWEPFLKAHELAPEAWTLAYTKVGQSRMVMPLNLRRFRSLVIDKHGDDLAEVNQKMGTRFQLWTSFTAPVQIFSSRRVKKVEGPLADAYREFAGTRPLHERFYFSADGFFQSTFLRSQYTDVKHYNKLHKTDYKLWHQIPLTYRAEGDKRQKKDWELFARSILNLRWLRLDSSEKSAYTTFLRAKHRTVEGLNKTYETDYKSFDAIPFHERMPRLNAAASDWNSYIQGWLDPIGKKMHQARLESLDLVSTDRSFRTYLQSKYTDLAGLNKAKGTNYANWLQVHLPQQTYHYQSFKASKGTLRNEFTTRNFITVFDTILLRGRAVLNTIIYCGLAILSALVVNPLAAYGLSRYKPPSSYKILLFMMLTMAFPPMVTQIPNFLLLREFNMLNTFWALILPGIANGYSIFLLKGFFDSLPSELYEAAEIDGAGEMRIFLQITMSLSKPILAVIALNAFTLSYSNFMMALLTCQDDRMWTIMPWLYQLQQMSCQGVVFASLIVAAIPTFLVFALCQNVIMRGIVVPVEK